MAQLKYRGNLSTAEFPLNPLHMGASVIVAGYDQNLSRYMDSPESRDLSIGIPQIYAAENVLPTKEGMASVVYEPIVTGLVNHFSMGRHPATVYTSSGTALPCTLAVNVSNGRPLLVTLQPDGGMSAIEQASVPLPHTQVINAPLSSAYVQGVSYLFVPASSGVTRPGLLVFSGDADDVAFEYAELSGLDEAEVRGVLGVNGYLLAYTDKAVAWSSTLQLLPDRVVRDTAYAVGELVRNPTVTAAFGLQYKCTTAGTTAATAPAYPSTVGGTVVDGTATFTAEVLSVDFVPSLETGAGGGLLEDARGEIITALAGPSGFMVYTAQNIVAATYTANAEYPYQFRSLPNSAGVQHASCVTPAADLGWHFALTTSGLMQVAPTGCKLVYPAVTHWLSSSEQYRFPAPIPGAALTRVANMRFYRLAFVQNRYLCVSKGTGITTMQACLVYDTALDRWGQLYLPHAYVTDRPTPENPGDIKHDLPIIVDSDGNTRTWRAYSGGGSIPTQPAYSWVLLGRYRHARTQNICVQEVTLASCHGGATESQVLPYITPDGGPTAPALAPLMYRDTRGYRQPGVHKYLGRVEGLDVSLLVQGPFELNSIELTLTTGGHS